MKRGDAASGERARPSPKRRLWPRLLGGSAALLVVAIIVVLYFLQPTQLTALLLSRASDALKLDVKTNGPGKYALRPEPRLVLPGLNATAPDSSTPFFRSARVEVALPWDTLRGRSADISSIVLKSPDIDIAGMQNWLATQPPSNKPFKFPTLTRGLEIDDGMLRGDGWRVEHFDLSLPSLADGKPAALQASGDLLRGGVASKFALTMAATPAGVGTGIRIDEAHLTLKADGELPSLTAKGNLIASDTLALDFAGSLQGMPARWAKSIDSSFATSTDTPFSISIHDGVPITTGTSAIGAGATAAGATSPAQSPRGLQVQFRLGDPKRQPSIAVSGHLVTGLMLDAELQGQLSRWPDAWPGLPTMIAAKSAPIVFHASYRGSIFLRDPVVFDVERADTKLQGSARIADVRAWIGRKIDTLLPPIDATLEAPQLDINGVQLRGVRIDLHDDPAPSQPATKPVLASPKP